MDAMVRQCSWSVAAAAKAVTRAAANVAPTSACSVGWWSCSASASSAPGEPDSAVCRPPRAGARVGEYSRGRAASTDFAEDPDQLSLDTMSGYRLDRHDTITSLALIIRFIERTGKLDDGFRSQLSHGHE